MAGALEAHDRSRFEVSALSIGPATNDEMETRLRGALDRFLDVEARNDREIAEIIRGLEIEMLVDLNGFALDSRTHVLAQRAAPLQVDYLGYSGTMGVSYFDYILADQTVLPPEHAKFYSEKIAWLPDSYMANDSNRHIAKRTPTRQECGLPHEAFVFCCFNQSFKFTPNIFHTWMRVVKATRNAFFGSVLLTQLPKQICAGRPNDAVSNRNV
jgi:protein O-GlcNAc transferase